MASPQQKVTIKINPKYGPKERQAIAQEIIDYIIDRSREGNGIKKNGRVYSFPKYSKEYMRSPEFRAAGKGKQVNLTLSGDLLSDISLLTHKAGSITIGHEKGTEENEKSHGNQTGSYGKPSGKASKARRYLGVNGGELRKILSEFPLNDSEYLAKRVSEVQATIAAAEEVSGRAKLEDLEDFELE